MRWPVTVKAAPTQHVKTQLKAAEENRRAIIGTDINARVTLGMKPTSVSATVLITNMGAKRNARRNFLFSVRPKNAVQAQTGTNSSTTQRVSLTSNMSVACKAKRIADK
jgi:hypothetical protein